MDNGTNSSNLYMREYKVVAVYGSPRRGGNTDMLLNRFIEGLKGSSMFSSGSGSILNIEKIFIPNLKISPCRECRHCSTDGECIVKDEMQQIYPKMIDCDLLVISSPVFFTSVSGHLKVFIDRFQRFWALKYELGKNIISKTSRKGILLSCAGSKQPDIFDCTKKMARALFDVLNMKYYADFLYNSIDFKGDILKNPDDLKKVYEFARNTFFDQ
jgi:NAD(P)H-dependent FMN reductase